MEKHEYISAKKGISAYYITTNIINEENNVEEKNNIGPLTKAELIELRRKLDELIDN